MDITVRSELLASADVYHQGRLRAVGSKGASIWLSIIPTTANTFHYNNAIFRAASSFRLGRVDVSPTCTRCGLPQDPMGIHATSHHGKSRAHQGLKLTFASFCSSAHLAPLVEPPFPFSSLRPADCFVPFLDLGCGYCFDFAVTHPLQKSFLKQSSVTAQSAATKYSQDIKSRNSSYQQLCATNGFTYVPLVVDQYNAWCPDVHPYMRSVARYHSILNGCSEDFSYYQLMASLSVNLQRSNALNLIAARSSPF